MSEFWPQSSLGCVRTYYLRLHSISGLSRSSGPPRAWPHLAPLLAGKECCSRIQGELQEPGNGTVKFLGELFVARGKNIDFLHGSPPWLGAAMLSLRRTKLGRRYWRRERGRPSPPPPSASRGAGGPARPRRGAAEAQAYLQKGRRAAEEARSGGRDASQERLNGPRAPSGDGRRHHARARGPAPSGGPRRRRRS